MPARLSPSCYAKHIVSHNTQIFIAISHTSRFASIQTNLYLVCTYIIHMIMPILLD